jgi:hypothetical protein
MLVGKKWLAVAALLPDRTNEQCRLRWINKLDFVKGKNPGKWTPADDVKLRKAVKKHGKEWVAVAKLLPNRTNTQCCSRWIHTLDPTLVKKDGKCSPEEDEN